MEPTWSLKVTHGEITSITVRPLWAIAAFSIACNCFLSPLNDRATNVAPPVMSFLIGLTG